VANDDTRRPSAGTTEEHEETYLTSTQAARILHVSSKTLDRWADQGRVRCSVTLGGHRRFTRRTILAVARQMESAVVASRQE
jgi:excisionase family DNA binding protein